MSYDISELFELQRNLPPYPQSYAGRGIVISAGGSYLPSAYVAIKSLRHAGCTLPIQLWHLGSREFPELLQSLFTQHGVEAVDAFEVRKTHPMRCLSGWESKPYSIVYSPFKEVFSFDADNIALLNPEFLFDSPEFKTHGSMFWPDFPSDKNDFWMIKPGAWELLGLEPQQGQEIETGQVLIDKEKTWKALMLSLHMNANSDFFYKHCSHGDTDTYTLAWLMQKQSRCLIPHQATFVMGKRPAALEHWIRIHFSPDGRELFQHARKWILPVEQNIPFPNYRLEELCLSWLREFETALRQAQAVVGA